jgi:hypothetical protein
MAQNTTNQMAPVELTRLNFLLFTVNSDVIIAGISGLLGAVASPCLTIASLAAAGIVAGTLAPVFMAT